MKIITRVDESREMIRQALGCAYGSYIEQEGKKNDQWRENTVGQYGLRKYKNAISKENKNKN